MTTKLARSSSYAGSGNDYDRDEHQLCFRGSSWLMLFNGGTLLPWQNSLGKDCPRLTEFHCVCTSCKHHVDRIRKAAPCRFSSPHPIGNRPCRQVHRAFPLSVLSGGGLLPIMVIRHWMHRPVAQLWDFPHDNKSNTRYAYHPKGK